MSELKEYEVRIGRKLYQTLPPIVYVVADDNQPKLLNDKVYLKSEADKMIARHKYKRCVAMAQEWRSYATFCGMQSSWHNNRGFGKTAEKWTWKECHAWTCVKRWMELAEKFKEAK